jgi:hypothetical protein
MSGSRAAIEQFLKNETASGLVETGRDFSIVSLGLALFPSGPEETRRDRTGPDKRRGRE